MFKHVFLGCLFLGLVACGAESESDLKNKDLEPNNSLENAQLLKITDQVDQENLEAQVSLVDLQASLDGNLDVADYFTVGEIDSSGMYIVYAGFDSRIPSEDVLTEFDLEIFLDGESVHVENPLYPEQPSTNQCIYINAGEELTVGVTTEGDEGKYSLHISYFGSSTSYCDVYNGDAEPEQPQDGTTYFMYDLDVIDGTCYELEYFDFVYAEAALTSGYNSGTCIDALGTEVFAYCDTESNQILNTKYYFKAEMTTANAENMCSIWDGSFSILDVVNPIDTDNPYYTHEIDALGSGVCLQSLLNSQSSHENFLSYGYLDGKCESTLGSAVLIGHCDVESSGNVIDKKYVFSNNHTVQEVIDECAFLEGDLTVYE